MTVPAIVQSATPVAGNTLVDSQSITLTGVTGGNDLIVYVSYLDLNQTTEIPPNNITSSNTGTVEASNVPSCVYYGSVLSGGAGIFRIRAAGAGTHVVSFNPFGRTGSNGSVIAMAMQEVSGLDQTSTNDHSSSNSGSGATEVLATTGSTGTLASPNDFVAAAMNLSAIFGLGDAQIIDPPLGFTSIFLDSATVTDVGAAFDYINGPGSTVGISASWTFNVDSGGVTWQGAICAFKPAGTGGNVVTSREDDLTIADSTVIKTRKRRVIEDDLVISESFIKVLSNSHLVTKVTSETIIVNDVEGRALSIDAMDESTTVTDSASKIRRSVRVPTETIVMFDADVVKRRMSVIVTELLAINDSFIAKKPSKQSVEDDLIVVDSTLTYKRVVRLMTEALVIADTAVFTVYRSGTGTIYTKLAEDALTIVDMAIQMLRRVRRMDEGLIVSDATFTVKTLVKIANEALTLVDSQMNSKAGFTNVRFLSDAIALADFATSISIKVRTLESDIVVQDVTTMLFRLVRVISEFEDVTDSTIQLIVKPIIYDVRFIRLGGY